MPPKYVVCKKNNISMNSECKTFFITQDKKCNSNVIQHTQYFLDFAPLIPKTNAKTCIQRQLGANKVTKMKKKESRSDVGGVWRK